MDVDNIIETHPIELLETKKFALYVLSLKFLTFAQSTSVQIFISSLASKTLQVEIKSQWRVFAGVFFPIIKFNYSKLVPVMKSDRVKISKILFISLLRPSLRAGWMMNAMQSDVLRITQNVNMILSVEKSEPLC